MTDTLDSTHGRSDSGKIIENNRKRSSSPDRPFLQLSAGVRKVLLTESLVNVTMSLQATSLPYCGLSRVASSSRQGSKILHKCSQRPQLAKKSTFPNFKAMRFFLHHDLTWPFNMSPQNEFMEPWRQRMTMVWYHMSFPTKHHQICPVRSWENQRKWSYRGRPFMQFNAGVRKLFLTHSFVKVTLSLQAISLP